MPNKEKGAWRTIHGMPIFIKDGQDVGEAFKESLKDVERANNKKVDTETGIKHLDLPKEEYARMDSIVRSKFANKIPTREYIEDSQNLYRFYHDKKRNRTLFTQKLQIDGNEDIIKAIREKHSGKNK